MIFKTWLTDLTKIQGVVTNIKNISTWANGSTGLLNPTVVNSLSSAINGLNLQQAQLALSTKNLTKEQMNQVLVQAGLIASEDQIQAELVQSALAQSNVSSETQKAIVSALGLTGANEGLSFSFEVLAGSIKQTMLAMTMNPMTWIMAIPAIIYGAVKAYDALTVSIEEAQESLEESVSDFESVTNEVESLQDELETCTDRLAELQKLADNGTISVADEKELELLKETNDELERKIALKQAEQIREQKEVLEDANELADKKIKSEYVGHRTRGKYYYDNVTSDEELLAAIEAYDKYSELQKQNPDINYSKHINNASNKIVEMYDNIFPAIEAYDKLIDAGYQLSDEEQMRYDQLKAAQDAYLLYNYDINGTIEAYKGLNTEQQRNIILNRLIEQGLSDIQAQSILDNISNDDLDELWDKDFSFTPPEFTDYDTAEEYGKAYAEAWLNGLQEASDNNIKTDNSLSSQIAASSESLDQFQESIKSVSEAYTTLLSGNYSSSDLLDSIQTINETLSSMGKDINWELIDNMEELNDVILHVSDTYLDSFLADNNIDPNSNFAKMLQNVVDETLRVEAAYDSLNNSIDNIQSSYQTLTDAIEEYNSTGYLTLDTLQQVLAIDNEYISCLIDENGQIALNEQTYQALTAAKLDDAKNTVIQEGIQELENIALQNNAIAADKAEISNSNFINRIQNGIATAKNWVKSLFGIAEAQDVVNQTADGMSLEDAYAEAARVNRVAADDIMSAVYAKLSWIDSVSSHISTDFNTISGSVESTAAESTESAEDTVEDMEDLLDKYLDYYEAQLEAGQISYQEYLDKCTDITEKYHTDGLISEEKYWDSVQQIYENQLSIYDRVISAVVDRIDDEIDALEEQKDAIESSYQLKIDTIQTEIDKLEEANDAREAQIDLEKSQYELERAINQRVNKVYNGTEFVYEADTSAIRDAQNDLDEKLYEMNLSKLEAQITALENEMNRATKDIDAQIDKLEDYKDQWNSVADEYKKVRDKMYADQLLGADWELEILEGRLDVLEEFKNQYIAIQQEIADAAVNSALAQINAINAVSVAQSGSTNNSDLTQTVVGSSNGASGTSTSLSTTTTRPLDQIVSNKRYKAVANGSGKTLGTFASEADAWAYLVNQFGTMIAHQSYHVSKFAKGGIVSDKDSNILDPIAKSIGEDHLVAVKNNEMIIPANNDFNLLSSDMLQSENELWTKWQQNIPYFSSMFQPDIQLPNYDYFNFQSNNNNPVTPVVQNINLTLPNVTNYSGYERIEKELKQMQIDAVQFAHKK